MNQDVGDTTKKRGVLLLLLIVLAVAGIAAARQTWLDIFDNGMRRADAIHVFMAIPLCLWLVWTRRQALEKRCPRPSVVGPLLIAAGWAASSYGYHTSGQTLWHGGVVIVLIGCVVSAIGLDLFRYFLPAVAALMFVVPAPGFVRKQLEGPMEIAAARGGKFLFDVLGMDVEMTTKRWAFGEKYIFRQDELDLFVSDICQRSQMFFVVFMVAFAFAFGGSVRSTVGRIVILLSVPALAIVCDLLRLVPLVWYYCQHPEAVNERYHRLIPWLLVPIAYSILWGAVALFHWVWSPDAEET